MFYHDHFMSKPFRPMALGFSIVALKLWQGNNLKPDQIIELNRVETRESVKKDLIAMNQNLPALSDTRQSSKINVATALSNYYEFIVLKDKIDQNKLKLQEKIDTAEELSRKSGVGTTRL